MEGVYSEEIKGTLYQMFEGRWWTTRKKLIKELKGNGTPVKEEEVNSILTKLSEDGKIGTLTRKLKDLVNFGYREDLIKKLPELGLIAGGNSDRIVIYDTREPER